MYEFLLDGTKTLYYPGDAECSVIDPEINLALSEAGSLEFKMPEENPYYNSLHLRQSMISVMRDGVEIFNGEVRECPRDSNNMRNVYVVGELAFLHNSIQPQIEYGDIGPSLFFRRIIQAHNEQVEERQQFTPGIVSVPSGGRSISFYTDHNETLDAIRTMLIDVFGGALRIRKTGGTRYLDYLTVSEFGDDNLQGVTFGENLLDYAESYSANSVITALIPRGAVIQDENGAESVLQKRVDITSVNNGKDYLINTAAANTFGRIWAVKDFDEIDSPAALKTAGQKYLQDSQYEDLELTLTAADLSQLDNTIDAFRIGDKVTVTAPPYGMNKVFPIKSLTLYPQAPQNDRLKLSANTRRKGTYTAQQTAASTQTAVAYKKDDLNIKTMIMQEMSNIVAQFTGSEGGYKLTEYDADGRWLRDLYMDNPDKDLAQNIMQISMAGIAFSEQGYSGPYTSAWTLGGVFNADRILTGTLIASIIKAGILSDVAGKNSWNLETGALTTKDATMTNVTIDGGKITTKSGNKKAIMENGFLRGYRNDVIYGLLDLSPTYTDSKKRVALWAKDELMLQAGGVEGSPTKEIKIDKDGIHPQGLNGWTVLGDMRVQLDGGLIMQII